MALQQLSSRQRILYSLLCGLGTLIAASAYVVYANVVTGYPVGASYFWFMLFATATAVFLPRKIHGLFRQDLSWEQKGSLLYPEHPIKSAVTALARYGIIRTLLIAVFYTGGFALTLRVLQMPDQDVVITFLVIIQLEPLINITLGTFLLKDGVRRWGVFCLGMAITLGGVMIYRHELWENNAFKMDRATLFALLVLIAHTRNVWDAQFRRTLSVPQVGAVAVTMIGGSLLGGIWMFAESYPALPPLPSIEQALGLLYLGVMPTAISPVLYNTARDKIGVPVAEAISNLRPIFAIIVGMIPISWFALEPKLDTLNWIGIVLTILGVMLVALKSEGGAAEH